MSWYLDVLKKYAVFSGRARRKEYWMFTLINIVIMVGLQVIAGVLAGMDMAALGGIVMVLYVIYALAVLIPGIAVSIRRLHDTSKSGWFILIAFVPLVGGLILLFFMVQDSTPGPNDYGPNPKEGGAVA